jgi:hypothetical protein
VAAEAEVDLDTLEDQVSQALAEAEEVVEGDTRTAAISQEAARTPRTCPNTEVTPLQHLITSNHRRFQLEAVMAMATVGVVARTPLSRLLPMAAEGMAALRPRTMAEGSSMTTDVEQAVQVDQVDMAAHHRLSLHMEHMAVRATPLPHQEIHMRLHHQIPTERPLLQHTEVAVGEGTTPMRVSRAVRILDTRAVCSSRFSHKEDTQKATRIGSLVNHSHGL